MRTAMQARPQFTNAPKPTRPRSLSARTLLAAALMAIALCAASPLLASTVSSSQAATHKPVHPHKRTVAVHQPAPAPQMPPETVAPPPPKLPDWPVNDQPSEATVIWNSQGLRIDASNSSLTQIMRDISNSTGVKVQGLGSDERIFGSYGPGKARDVLAKLLEGTGYNVIMIGDQGEGTPRQVLLTAQSKGDAQAAADNQTAAANANANDENSEADDQPEQQPQPAQQPQPPALRNGFTPGAPPRTPQQIMQEMQQRQQQQMQQSSPQ